MVEIMAEHSDSVDTGQKSAVQLADWRREPVWLKE